MKTLALSKNKISTLPEDMGKMTKLENLNLSFNLLQSIPSSFQQLKHLRFIHCDNAQQTILISILRFREVNLSNNNVSTFPSALLNLKQLNVLDLANNKIRAIPEEVQRLEATELVLNCNQVSLIAPEVSLCPRLRTLRLEENCLALESIPTSLLAER